MNAFFKYVTVKIHLEWHNKILMISKSSYDILILGGFNNGTKNMSKLWYATNQKRRNRNK
jgi:hypothetical protein